MKTLVVGKENLMHWPQTVYKFLPENERSLFIYNAHTPISSVFRLFGKKCRNAYAAKMLEKQIASFKPDVILFVASFLLPQELFDAAAKFKGIVKAGWVGDNWAWKNPAEISRKAAVLDALFVTDTGFLKDAETFDCPCFYLPLCVDETVFVNRLLPRTERPFFVGVANPQRTALFEACEEPCVIYGKGWDTSRLKQHEVHNQTLSYDEVQKFVNTSVAPVNMTYSKNNVNGVNFRTFEIPACGGLIITNNAPDLALNYDIGKEAVAYETPEEFNALVKDIVRNPLKYSEISEAGYIKTLEKHTYTKRLEQMADFLKTVQPKTK